MIVYYGHSRKGCCVGESPARPPWWWRWFLRPAWLELENRRLRREIARLSASEHTLRNVIALHPYNPDPGSAA